MDQHAAGLGSARHGRAHISPREIGSIPAVTVQIPREMRLADLAALAARAGYRIRWIRRGKAA